MKLVKLKRFRHDSGNCWITDLPAGLPEGDSEGAHVRSPLRLFESGDELGPGHAAHALIRETGGGAFSHWGHQVFLSTSDNSSPRFNRRDYYALMAESISERLTGRLSRVGGGVDVGGFLVPVNYAQQESRPEKIQADAAYAIAIARLYAGYLPGGKSFLAGRSVLELGPGANFATAMTLLAWGATRVAVADRFLTKFQPSYHVPLYREVASRLADLETAVDTSPFDICVARGEHSPEVIQAVESPIEGLPDADIEPFDIVLSNAVLEHVFHPLDAVHGLQKVMNNGAFGFHQVDFRDHRDLKRPLEFLLLDELSFVDMFHSQHGECGNRVRPYQFRAMFESARFVDIDFTPDMSPDEAYLKDFEPRLRAASASPFATIEMGRLREISGRFVLRKP